VRTIKIADLSTYKDFGRVSTVNQTGDDYEVYSVIRETKTSHKSELTNLRSKSSNISKGYSESEVRYKKQNYFGKPTTDANIENLGFNKDFLDFDAKSPHLLMSDKNNGFESPQRYDKVDFSKLQELDFSTNRGANNPQENKKDFKDINLNMILEVNEKDYETPKYQTFGAEPFIPRMLSQKGLKGEENFVDL
jgi:hypothetical protein